MIFVTAGFRRSLEVELFLLKSKRKGQYHREKWHMRPDGIIW